MFPRSSEGFRSHERRRGLVFVVAGLAALYVLLTALSAVWTDYLWFDSVGYTSVWRTKIATSLALGLVGILLTFVFVYLNLVITDRLSPRIESLELREDEELVERFREWVEPRLRWVRIMVAGLFALLLGATMGDWRAEFLQFVNPGAFGVEDPVFGNDVGFYLFRLPFWTLLVNWAFNLVALTTITVIALHYLNGAIRFERGARPSIRTGVKTHVSALGAVLALLRAAGYRIDMFELLYSPHSQFFGAGFTDINARLPALQLLILVSLAAAVLFLFNIRRPGWTLAIVSVGAWLFVSIAAGVVYPALVQRFRVDPGALVREREFITHAIEFTRAAYALDRVERREFAATADLTLEEVDANDLTVSNLRLWDPDVLPKTYQVLQEIRPYYRLDYVDTDRYVIDGQTTQVMSAVRELEEAGVPEPQSWQTTRLIYTHGFGMVLSPANVVEADGQPRLLVRDVPPQSDVFELEQTRVYFGESYAEDRYVIVKTGSAPQEADFPLEQSSEQSFSKYEYTGEGGIELSTVFHRLAFALRYRDLNILISGELRPDSRILVQRNIEAIVTDIAPFLAADSDPYPVLLDNRLVYVVDMYSLSNRYPYSQPWATAETDRLRVASGLPPRGPNYIRNSVKATVDAYDGTVNFYIMDESIPDPVVRSWQGAYPGLFREASEMPAGLVNHLRYPQDMFTVQGEIYRRYHMTDPDDFFAGVDTWSIPQDPSSIRRTSTTRLNGDRPGETGTDLSAELGMLPYYLTLDLPGDDTDDLSYVLMQPFNTFSRPNMSSFLVADATPGRFGRLIDYRMPRGRVVEGPGQVGDRIEQDGEIAQQFTLWDQRGSNVVKGDLLVVPIEDSILYIQPIFLEAEDGGLPEFQRVVAVYGDRIEWATSLDDAIALALGETPTTEPEEPSEPGEPEEPPTGTIEELLALATELLAQADDALRAGNLGEYQRLVNEARRLIEEAVAQLGPEPAAEATARTAYG